MARAMVVKFEVAEDGQVAAKCGYNTLASKGLQATGIGPDKTEAVAQLAAQLVRMGVTTYRDAQKPGPKAAAPEAPQA